MMTSFDASDNPSIAHLSGPAAPFFADPGGINYGRQIGH